MLILYFKNLLLTINCENLAKQLLLHAVFLHWYLSEFFWYDLSNTIFCPIGSALTKHPVASQIWTHNVYANRLIILQKFWHLGPILYQGAHILTQNSKERNHHKFQNRLINRNLDSQTGFHACKHIFTKFQSEPISSFFFSLTDIKTNSDLSINNWKFHKFVLISYFRILP